MYNPTDFALVFSIASILLKYERFERCIVIPCKTEELLLKSPGSLPLHEIYNKFDYSDDDSEDYNDYFLETGQYLNQSENGEKIILVGIHPANKQEELIIKEFVYFNNEKIKFWFDDAKWPKKILKFIRSENNNIFINSELTTFGILMSLEMTNNKNWLQAEKAIRRLDLKNETAKRYVQAMLVNRTTGKNYQLQDDFDFYLFMSIVNEIISKAKNPMITELEESFVLMEKKTMRSKQKLTDQNPIFRKAKRLGRPVGSIMLGKVQSYLDIQQLLEYGLKKYPWLCIVSATITNRKYLFMESKIIPIADIMALYGDSNLDKIETLKLANVELLKYNPQRARNKKIDNKKPDH